ncbi:uncharacterized protein GGS25DRAFT_520503 [Hypoxylon fragiforme]|uniref:uncharacterized protein n=1 Tax=Hypoxylon fragiforme TaxID=63214 RepID=UPI0020C60DD2|nr:uncharacterized protein GGS25DRAFT_520503 [Hypoxylon fragiforme]KAI2609700.1 hypothetical protein GGS25DRAFT_520503 [Hypoxylon fragiforme]
MARQKAPINKRPFAGKTPAIREQYERFQSQTSARADVEAYRLQTPGHEYPNLPKWVQAQTPFTSFQDRHGPEDILGESAHALLIGNHASFDVAQYKRAPERAGMSMVHVLAIPKASLFNAVSLTRDTVSIIDEMIALFRRAWADRGVRDKVLAHQLGQIKAQHAAEANPNGYGVALKHYRELERTIHGLGVDDFTFGFHLWPDHSVGHLHMHVVATPCRKYSTDAHDAKTKDALEVRDFILSLPEPEAKPEAKRDPELENIASVLEAELLLEAESGSEPEIGIKPESGTEPHFEPGPKFELEHELENRPESR